jgi:hypothetical protein
LSGCELRLFTIVTAPNAGQLNAGQPDGDPYRWSDGGGALTAQ